MPEAIRPWDQLLSGTAQLLLCDLQPGIVSRSKTTQPNTIRKAAGVLLQMAKLFSLPTVLSTVPEQQKQPELITELRNSGFAPEKMRMSASPFLDSATVEAVCGSDRKVLIIAGVLTEVVTLHAVLDACARGYQVLVPVDACGGSSERTENAAFRQMEGAGAVTTSVLSIATKLAPDFSTPQGQQIFGVVQPLF